MWTVRRLFFYKSQTAHARANCERSPVLVEPEGYRTFRHESPNDRFRRAVLPGREIPRPTISPGTSTGAASRWRSATRGRIGRARLRTPTTLDTLLLKRIRGPAQSRHGRWRGSPHSDRTTPRASP